MYFVFSQNAWEPLGGALDCRLITDDLEDAKAKADRDVSNGDALGWDHSAVWEVRDGTFVKIYEPANSNYPTSYLNRDPAGSD